MLIPCRSCQRHVRHREARCPFCGTAQPTAGRSAPASPDPRLSRSAQVLFCAAWVGTACAGAPHAESAPNAAAPTPSIQAADAGATSAADAAALDAEPSALDDAAADAEADAEAHRHGSFVAIYGQSVRTIAFHIQFKPNSDAFDKTATDHLDQLVSLMQSDDFHLEIEGHTSHQEKWNKTLSQRRADRVRNYLVSHGVAAERLKVAAYRDEKPIAAGSGPRNSRVQFVLIEKRDVRP